jgi:phosphoenolpyruvate-protein kinase (PTS system EI component)
MDNFIIRTADFLADASLSYLDLIREDNPKASNV